MENNTIKIPLFYYLVLDKIKKLYESGKVDISVLELSEELKSSAVLVGNVIRQLERLGFFKVEKRYKKRKSGRFSSYVKISNFRNYNLISIGLNYAIVEVDQKVL